MAFSIRIDIGNRVRDTIETLGGRRYDFVREAPEHRMEITGNGPELTEVIRRLQGLPGIPDLGEVARAYPALDPNFSRKLDL